MTAHTNNSRRRSMFVASALLVAGAATISAQTPDTRWSGWIGCWQSSTDANLSRSTPATRPDGESAAFPALLQPLGFASVASTPVEPKPPVLCVVPASGPSAVEVISIADGKVASRERVDASGERRNVDRDGCTGWQQATWSADGERVFLRSELGCGPGITRSTSGLLAMSQAGDWLDVQAVKAGRNAGVRVARYLEINLADAGVPAEIAQLVTGSQLARRTARVAAGAPLGATDVIEASKQADSSVVQSFLAERGQRFDLDAKMLVRLADAGVPGSVTDMMVAVSYPKEFIVRRPEGAAMGELRTSRDSARIASQYLADRCGSLADPFAYSPFGWGMGYDPFYSASSACAYRYGSYYGYPRYNSRGYQYGSSYGYSPAYYYGGYATSGPVIIVRAEAEHGRVVKGQGYTRPSGRQRGSEPSTSRGSSTSSGSEGTSSSGGSSGSAGSSSSGSSGSSGRTAIPRPPG